jgi:hypothetical protein
VLECITLGVMVEFVVEMLVDLAAGAVLDEETTEDSETIHPNDLAVEREHCQPSSASECLKAGSRLTLAYEHPRYPSAFRSLDVCQCGGPG